MTREEAIDVIKAFIAYGKHVNAFVYKDSTAIPIEALKMAIEALEKEQIVCGDCIHCRVMGEVTHYRYCDMWDSVVDPYGYCNYGERKE